MDKVTSNSMANRTLLDRLFQTGQIELRRSTLFDVVPGPMPEDFDFGRVEGMMLGLAVGDALGNTSESILPEDRRSTYGEIRDYMPNRHAGNKAIGLPSDDTQLAFWSLEQMIEDRGFHPEMVAKRFCGGQIFGIGGTMREFLSSCKSGKLAWFRCGPHSAGNGALMRIAPMVIPHLMTGTSDLWVDSALSAMITHNDSASIAACMAFVNMLWQLLQKSTPPQAEWWLRTYVDAAKELELPDSDYNPREGVAFKHEGTVWEFVQQRVSEAYEKDLSVLDACNQWYSGAYLLETVPCVIYILMQYGNDPEQAIIRAVNDTKDNDTVAAIVGAAVGALHGRKGLPRRWLEKLSGRTREDDDGRVLQLLVQARNLWREHAE